MRPDGRRPVRGGPSMGKVACPRSTQCAEGPSWRGPTWAVRLAEERMAVMRSPPKLMMSPALRLYQKTTNQRAPISHTQPSDVTHIQPPPHTHPHRHRERVTTPLALSVTKGRCMTTCGPSWCRTTRRPKLSVSNSTVDGDHGCIENRTSMVSTQIALLAEHDDDQPRRYPATPRCRGKELRVKKMPAPTTNTPPTMPIADHLLSSIVSGL